MYLLRGGRGGFRSEDGHWHTALLQVENENAAGRGTAGVSLFMAWGSEHNGEERWGPGVPGRRGMGMMEVAVRGLVYLFEVDALP